ncbi:MAG TPA: hypothetical protein VJH03_02510 [Blastocatellia bacterium]|nr:hypothetical protein [Blastocatellia bacterium]
MKLTDDQACALELITQVRAWWTGTGYDQGKEYQEDRDAFYRYIRHEMFPRWIATGQTEADLEVAKMEHARLDWLASGRTEEAFNQATRDARRSSFGKTANQEGKRFGIGCLGIIVAAFIGAVVKNASNNFWAAVFVVALLICLVVYGLWQRVNDQPERELTSLKLSDHRPEKDSWPKS